MPDWSPELVRMLPLKRGGMRRGQWYVGINRRKGVVWPTRNVVAVLEPGRAARLGHDLERRPVDLGDHAVRRGHARRAPAPGAGEADAAQRVFAPVFLGGGAEHADELEAGMARTVARLKAVAER